MRKIAFYLALFPLFLNAQSDTIKGYELGLTISSSVFEYSSPSLTNSIYFSCQRHYVSAGIKYYFDRDPNEKRTGFSANYRFIPNRVNKCLNFYFTSQLNFDSEKYEKTSSYLNMPGYHHKKMENIYLGLYAGYGLDVRFLRVIHFYQYIAFGCLTYKEYEFNESNQNGTIYQYARKDNLFSGYRASFVVAAGFGVDILGKTKQ